MVLSLPVAPVIVAKSLPVPNSRRGNQIKCLQFSNGDENIRASLCLRPWRCRFLGRLSSSLRF